MALAAHSAAAQSLVAQSLAAQSPAAEPLPVDRAQQLLRVLSEPIRLQVVQSLSGGERCVCDLTAELQLAQPKLSFHLKVMKEAGLIAARQQGRWMYYRLQPELLLALSHWLVALADCCERPAAPCS
jgi:ArsR family transcriptional regulator